MNMIYVEIKKTLKIFGIIYLLYLIKDFIKCLKIKLPINMNKLFIIVLFKKTIESKSYNNNRRKKTIRKCHSRIYYEKKIYCNKNYKKEYVYLADITEE